MRAIPESRRAAVLGVLEGVARAVGGPTDEQRRLLDALARHVAHLDPDRIEPIGASSVADALRHESDRHLATQGVVLVEMTCHPATDQVSAATGRYLTALGAEEDLVRLVRDEAHGAREAAAADLARLLAPSLPEPGLEGDDGAESGARLEGLADLAPGTVGRSFADFYRRNGFGWPVPQPRLVRHDFHHVLAGYEAVPEEVALQAFLTGAAERNFPGLLASLLLFEAGLVPCGDIVPTVGVLARPGAAELFADAVVRGAGCAEGIAEVDHLALVERPLAEVRAELGIDPPPDGPFTFVA